MKNPCVKDCPRRSEECHATCEDYAAFAAWRAEQRAKRQEKLREDYLVNSPERMKRAIRRYHDSRRKG